LPIWLTGQFKGEGSGFKGDVNQKSTSLESCNKRVAVCYCPGIQSQKELNAPSIPHRKISPMTLLLVVAACNAGYLHITITAPSLSMWKRSLRKDKRRRTTIEDGSKRRAAEGLGGEFRSRCAVRIRQMFTPQSVRHASKIRIRFRFLLETTEAVVPEITLASGQSSRTTGSQNPVYDGFEGREPSFQERHGDGSATTSGCGRDEGSLWRTGRWPV
jgi:hypothetical protein